MTRSAVRLGGLAMAAAGLPLATYLLALRPAALSDLTRDEARLESMARDLQALEITANKLDEFKADRALLSERLAVVEHIRPREPRVEPTLNRLRAIATDHGLTVLEGKGLPAGEATAPLELRLRGEYPDLASFIRGLPRLARFVRVDRVEMERLQRPQFELRLRVTVFYWKGW
jgi:Tfp pilus assembly protein PilO